MAKKQTYAKVMKDLTSKKAKYEAGLEEAKRLGSASGIADYQRRLTKLNAGMDQLFQAQETRKMAKGGYTGMPKYNQGGPTNTTRGGWYVEQVPNDGSNPQAFVNAEGNYLLLRNKDGRATTMTPEMARIIDSDNPSHLFFKLDQGDFDMEFIKNSWDNTESVDYNNPETQARLAENPAIPNGGHELDFPSSEMPADLQQEMGYTGPSVHDMLTNPDFGQATGPAGVQTGAAGPIGAREAAQLGGKIFDTDPTFTNVNMIPAAEVASPSTPAAPKNYAGAEPTPLGFGPMKTLGLQQVGGPNTGGLVAPTNMNVGAELTGAPSFRSRVEDKAMDIAGFGQKVGGAIRGMDPMTKQKLGMGLGAAAQFLPDISAMRAMDDIQGPEALPFERLQLMNADVQVGNQLNQIDQASARAMAAADRNVSNPAVAAAMKRANQRIAAGQKANVLNQEAQMESKMRNQNMMLANENMNRNRMLDYQNRQATVDFENQKLAAKNRMRQQMGMKLGQVFGDFQNLNADANKFNLLSKMYDPSLLDRNGINMATMLGYTNNDND
jgi:hypothetical protein